jgi:hypothetical protein
MTDPTTLRAEQIREDTGRAWEQACLQAERERDAVRVTEHRGIAYFADYSDAVRHNARYVAGMGRLVLYGRGWAVQVYVSGPYLNAAGELA